jgi:sensor histidine kinase regulating citrate/malate metabolism
VKIVITVDGKGFDAQPFSETGFESTQNVVNTDSGRGLGVNAVISAVKNLQGTIEFESRPGKGTSFSFQIPLREPSPNTDQVSF